MLVSQSIPNLIQGISQQPDSMRLPEQGEVQENCYSDIVEGLTDRKPTQHIAKIYSGNLGDVFVHCINRDAAHRYFAVIGNGTILVTDINGNLQTVNTPNGTSYLNTSDPRSNIRAISISDYTFIVNKTVTTAMSSATSPTRNPEGLVFVKQGFYASNYSIYINGVNQASTTTSATDVTTLKTDAIASALATSLTSSVGGSFNISVQGGVIWIQSKTSTDFRLDVIDSQGGASLQSFKGSTATFSNLPTVAPQGFVIGVNGTPGSGGNNASTYSYFVTFNCANAGDNFAIGSWTECVAGGVQTTIDPTTMPLQLVNNNDGTFTLSQVSWSNRTVGNATSVPTPSFIGSPINDLFFFKERLGVLADDNIVMSEIGQYFNFFLTTAATLLDSDPIDVSVLSDRVAILRSAVPFMSAGQGQLILFSDQSQFTLQGSPLTAQTVQVDKTTDFASDSVCKPISAGRNIYFLLDKNQYHGLREYYVDDAYTQVNDAVDVSAHVPTYIPVGGFKMSVSTIEDCLVLATTGDPGALYVYKYHWAGMTKEQSSWSRWTFGTNATVLGFEFIQTTLYLIVQRGDGVYLESLSVVPGMVDPYVSYITLLDRRLTDTQCTATYNATTNQTTFTLPYAPDDTPYIVTRASSASPTVAPGRVIPVVSNSGTSLVVSGDYHTTPLFIGNRYTRTWQFPHFYIREATANGGKTINAQGRLQIRTLTLLYDTTGFFQLVVTPSFRTPSTYTFTARVTGQGDDLINSVALSSGSIRLPILARNNQVTIQLTSNSHLPFRILSADWEGDYTARSRRT